MSKMATGMKVSLNMASNMDSVSRNSRLAINIQDNGKMIYAMVKELGIMLLKNKHTKATMSKAKDKATAHTCIDLEISIRATGKKISNKVRDLSYFTTEIFSKQTGNLTSSKDNVV